MHQDSIRSMHSDHDVLVAASRPGMEAPHVIGEQMGKGQLVEFDRIGINMGGVDGIGATMWGPGLSGTDVLPRLSHVTERDFIGDRAIAGGEGRGETRPGSIGPVVDGSKPRQTDRVPSRGMQVGNQGRDAREVICPGMGHERVR